jgi:hypothetical protein
MEHGEIGTKMAEELEKYSKNPITLQRYLSLHTEIQGWMA